LLHIIIIKLYYFYQSSAQPNSALHNADKPKRERPYPF